MARGTWSHRWEEATLGAQQVLCRQVGAQVSTPQLGVQRAAQAGIWNMPGCLWVRTPRQSWSPTHARVSSILESVVLVLTYMGMCVLMCSQRACTATCPPAKVLGT